MLQINVHKVVGLYIKAEEISKWTIYLNKTLSRSIFFIAPLQIDKIFYFWGNVTLEFLQMSFITSLCCRETNPTLSAQRHKIKICTKKKELKGAKQVYRDTKHICHHTCTQMLHEHFFPFSNNHTNQTDSAYKRKQTLKLNVNVYVKIIHLSRLAGLHHLFVKDKCQALNKLNLAFDNAKFSKCFRHKLRKYQWRV